MNVESYDATSQYRFCERSIVKREILNLAKGWDQHLGLNYKRTGHESCPQLSREALQASQTKLICETMSIEGYDATSQYRFRERSKVKREILNLEKGWDQHLGLKYKRTGDYSRPKVSREGLEKGRALTTGEVLPSAQATTDSCGFHTLLNQPYFVHMSSILSASNPRLMLLPVDSISSPSRKSLAKLHLRKNEYLWICAVSVMKIDRTDESRISVTFQIPVLQHELFCLSFESSEHLNSVVSRHLPDFCRVVATKDIRWWMWHHVNPAL